MTAPNIVNVTSITGKTAVLAANSTAANVLSNASSSNTVVKVNTVTVANYSNAAITANVDIYRSTTAYLIVGNVSVPANSTMVVSGKDTAFYLEEGDGLRATTSANASVISSYEVIS
jgi:hypothetical protein